MALFTVGIPTYNRAHFLPYTISCLLQQTYQDFEVIISDNASTDHTPEIVRQFNDKRIRYVRQTSHLCASDNFGACADLARGEWMVINQDDDILSPLFLERCAQAIRKEPHIVMYAAEVSRSTDITRHFGTSISSMPIGHHWDQPQPRLIPGVQIAALSWFVSTLMPPAQATPIHLFRKHYPRGPEGDYLADVCYTSRVACTGVVALEGYVGAIMRSHPLQTCLTLPDVARLCPEKNCAALLALFQQHQINWQKVLRETLPEFPLSYREGILNYYVLNKSPVPLEAVQILAESVAAERGLSVAALVDHLKNSGRSNPRGRLDRWGVPKPVKRFVRGILFAMGKELPVEGKTEMPA